eukprot:CAMPEP_0172081198 /NCGR_PEP_ID=MMETSP1043-20130122/19174_1 /TAXON_ID=464988 /ORGANISM="Hemiselmis andersenii, Strain CCMP441" /LENGTH=96 /DNA_ID=CAMNT_0012742623 /DNA_START=389 /DNA_END=679 /DNA_ORIENTATION=+
MDRRVPGAAVEGHRPGGNKALEEPLLERVLAKEEVLEAAPVKVQDGVDGAPLRLHSADVGCHYLVSARAVLGPKRLEDVRDVEALGLLLEQPAVDF